MTPREELEALRRLAQLEAKAGGGPKSEDDLAKEAFNKAMSQGWGTGVPPFIHELGGKATDLATKMGFGPETSAAVGAGTNFLANAVPAAMTSGRLQSPTPPTLPDFMTYPQRRLMQSAVKPSPTFPPKQADQALRTMLRENIYPTASGMEKVSKLTGKLDNQVESLIAGAKANVPVARIGDMRDLNTKVMKQMNPQDDLAAVREAWDKFKTSPLIKGKTEIPVQLAHELKRGTYSSLAGKYGEVGSAATEAQKTLARNAREAVASAVPKVQDPLARQAALMNVREVAGPRAMTAGNKDILGLGGLRMDDPKSAATFLMDRWGAFKAFVAMQINAGTKPEVLAPLVMAEAAAEGKESEAPALLRLLQSMGKGE